MTAQAPGNAIQPRPGPGDRPSRPRDDELLTRKPLGWWDRVKFLLLFAITWFVLAWSTVAQFYPLISVTDAFRRTLRTGAWVLVLFGLELIRQIHFLISEHSARYHYFWTHRVFGWLNQRMQKVNPWNRYRLARAAKWLFVIVVAAIVLAAVTHTSAFTALFELPAKLVGALPF